MKKIKTKKIKVKRVKISPLRGAKGRFVSKAQVKGKAKIKNFFDIVSSSAFEIARNELKGVAEATADEIRRRIAYQTVKPMGGKKFGLSRRFDQPLHPFTVRGKEDARTMISTGFYVNHIGVIEEKKGKGYTYRVGFTAPNHPSGISMNKLGRIHEYGAKIPVTDKMRGYLAWKGLHLRKETKSIIIPARPHFGVALISLKREMRKILKCKNKNIAQALRERLAHT